MDWVGYGNGRTLRTILECYWSKVEKVRPTSVTMRNFPVESRNWDFPNAKRSDPFSITTSTILST